MKIDVLMISSDMILSIEYPRGICKAVWKFAIDFEFLLSSLSNFLTNGSCKYFILKRGKSTNIQKDSRRNLLCSTQSDNFVVHTSYKIII